MKYEKNKTSRMLLRAAFLLFLVLFLVFTALFLSTWLAARNERRQFEELAALAVSEPEQLVQDTTPEENMAGESESVEETPADNSARFAALYERNPDFIGWLSILDTAINYPVMYRPDNPEYYLNYDFDGGKSSSGVPFFGEGCDLTSDNIIIYGHNMKNGTMFSELTNYSDESYFEMHPYITFDTLEENGTYAVIAAFREQVHYQDETGVFRYYDYGGDLTEEQFNDFIANIMELSLYDTGLTAEYGDRLLTLSTCAYHTGNGRFVVVAKRIDP